MTQDSSETFLFKKSKFAHFRDASGVLDVVDLSNDSVFTEQIYVNAIPTLSSLSESLSNINTLTGSDNDSGVSTSNSNIVRYKKIQLDKIADSFPLAYKPNSNSFDLRNVIQNYKDYEYFVFSASNTYLA